MSASNSVEIAFFIIIVVSIIVKLIQAKQARTSQSSERRSTPSTSNSHRGSSIETKPIITLTVVDQDNDKNKDTSTEAKTTVITDIEEPTKAPELVSANKDESNTSSTVTDKTSATFVETKGDVENQAEIEAPKDIKDTPSTSQNPPDASEDISKRFDQHIKEVQLLLEKTEQAVGPQSDQSKTADENKNIELDKQGLATKASKEKEITKTSDEGIKEKDTIDTLDKSTETKVENQSKEENKPKDNEASTKPDEPKLIKDEEKPIKDEAKPIKDETKPIKDEAKSKDEPKSIKDEANSIKDNPSKTKPAEQSKIADSASQENKNAQPKKQLVENASSSLLSLSGADIPSDSPSKSSDIGLDESISGHSNSDF